MAFERAFRTLLAGALALLLASCGGGSTVVSDFHPTRVVVFGDAMADMKLGSGETGLYTINSDGSTNNWARQLARLSFWLLARQRSRKSDNMPRAELSM